MNWLANTVLVLHALVVLFIVGGLLAIWAGAWLQRSWVRNRVFRLVHLMAIGVVAILAVLDIQCPLTVLEDWLRTGRAGPQGFIQRWVSHWLYYDLPGWVFTTAYAAFLLIVVVTWFRVPPRS
ncbi:DUF2784 domain-containing protein [Paraburkholderia dinghuensis]|uniref:DUF2784 family protein n=1 Tax=Paraburkholderia dinghuensis TaxID=2305225 RepID=A0A3N6PKA2_9BURK|nr:DUF2784 domain-containing protein [Paraburkholderia dinghuensis]RQH01660.1 DUF2784 family protein [Paraburkholderia dinghuensis]